MTELRSIHVHDAAAVQLQVLAAAWETSIPQVIDRLLLMFRDGSTVSEGERADLRPAGESGSRPIHTIYRGKRVKAHFDPVTHRTEIVDGPLAGRSYRTPSGAAIAVVEHYNPFVQPNRNGWTFWTDDQTGKPLQVLRGSAPRGDLAR